MQARIDDCLRVAEAHVGKNAFAIGDKATVADISMAGDLMFPDEEAGYDFAATHPAINGWLGRAAALAGAV